jgi:K(+)-stimulated pyrophosphate-energized sodium pump
VDLAVSVANDQGTGLTTSLAAVFLAISMMFVYRSFYSMRIE